MTNDPKRNQEHDLLDEALFEAARGEIPPMSPDLPDRIMAKVDSTPRTHGRAWPLVIVAAAAAFLLIQILPFLTLERESAPSLPGEVREISSVTGEDIPVNFTLASGNLSLNVILPETEKALSKNRDGVISFARAVQNTTLLFSGQHLADD